MRIHYQEISEEISFVFFVFGVVRRCIDHVLAIDGAAPSRDHRLVPRELLQEPQRVLLERDIEEDLDVVQKNHIGRGCAHDLREEAGQL